jgi:hypothetical protein
MNRLDVVYNNERKKEIRNSLKNTSLLNLSLNVNSWIFKNRKSNFDVKNEHDCYVTSDAFLMLLGLAV